MAKRASPFNSPLETGVRALSILEAAHPEACDLHRLVELDYLVVHSGDAGGPANRALISTFVLSSAQFRKTSRDTLDDVDVCDAVSL